MTIEEAKNIRLTDYLHSLGYAPVKQQGANLWYKSPFREENEASFKVNAEINKWYNFLDWVREAISSHWLRNFTVRPCAVPAATDCRSRHRTSDPCLSLSGAILLLHLTFNVWK